MVNRLHKVSAGILMSFFTITTLQAQQSVGIGTINPNTKSILDLTSTTQGFLMPRLTSAQRIAISGLTAADAGMMVYDITVGTLYYWNGTIWVNSAGAYPGWALTGNAGTIDGTHFIGTTDNVAVTIRVNNMKAGRIENSGSETALGYRALDVSTGSFNTAIGFNAAYSNTTGILNTAVGYQAMYNNNASNNTAMGVQAMYSNTTGGANNSFGYQALYSNVDGAQNAAFGSGALRQNVSGISNTAVGNSALRLSTGSSNTAVGHSSLYNNQSNFLTAVGYFSLYNNTIGAQNTAIGYNALTANIDGNSNTATGYQSLANSTGDFNTAYGATSAYSNVDGSNNTSIGTSALYTNISGNGNTSVGYRALYSNTTSSNTAVGSSALYTNTIGANNVAVGNTALFFNNTGTGNTAVGASSLQNSTGGNNTAIGSGSGGAVTTGSNNTLVGFGANVSSGLLTNATAVGANAVVSASNTLQLGNNADVKFDRALLAGGAAGTAGQVLTSAGPGVVPAWTTLSANVSGTGTNNYIAKWTGTNTLASSIMYDNGTQLGIGTTSPTAGTLVHMFTSVAGVNPTFAVENGIGNGSMRFSGGATHYTIGADVSDNTFKISNSAFGLNSSPRLTISSVGNVGIGTTNPIYNLHISGVNPSLTIEETSTSNANLMFVRQGIAKWYLLSNFLTPTDNIAFYDASIGQKVFQINQGGNIGIGTVSPVNRLDVEGGIAIGATYSGLNVAPVNGMLVEGSVAIGNSTASVLSGWGVPKVGVLIPTGSSMNGFIIEQQNTNMYAQIIHSQDYNTLIESESVSSVASILDIKNGVGANGGGGTSVMFVRADGNVGIGTTSPANKLDVEGGVAIGATYSGLNAAPANGLIVQGNVGIGTNSPIQNFHLEGRMYGSMGARLGGAAGGSAGMLEVYNTSWSDVFKCFDNGAAMIFKVENDGNVGIGVTTALHDVHIKQSTNALGAAAGGVVVESSSTTNKWRFYTSGVVLRFTYDNGAATDYISYTPGGLDWVISSDRRLKNSIEGLGDVLSRVMKLNPVKYFYNSAPEREHKGYGFIAQEVDQVFPEFVQKPFDGNQYYGLMYNQFGVISIKAIQEQQMRIEKIEEENKKLKESIEQIKILEAKYQLLLDKVSQLENK